MLVLFLDNHAHLEVHSLDFIECVHLRPRPAPLGCRHALLPQVALLPVLAAVPRLACLQRVAILRPMIKYVNLVQRGRQDRLRRRAVLRGVNVRVEAREVARIVMDGASAHIGRLMLRRQSAIRAVSMSAPRRLREVDFTSHKVAIHPPIGAQLPVLRLRSAPRVHVRADRGTDQEDDGDDHDHDDDYHVSGRLAAG